MLATFVFIGIVHVVKPGPAIGSTQMCDGSDHLASVRIPLDVKRPQYGGHTKWPLAHCEKTK